MSIYTSINMSICQCIVCVWYGGPEGSLRASKLRRFQIGLNCDVVVPSIV